MRGKGGLSWICMYKIIYKIFMLIDGAWAARIDGCPEVRPRVHGGLYGPWNVIKWHSARMSDRRLEGSVTLTAIINNLAESES